MTLHEPQNYYSHVQVCTLYVWNFTSISICGMTFIRTYMHACHCLPLSCAGEISEAVGAQWEGGEREEGGV